MEPRAYDVSVDTEPVGARPYFWQALRYRSAAYMKSLARFVMSEGSRYRELELSSDALTPRKADDSRDAGLDGWSFMMRTASKDFALLYFENQAHRARSAGWNPNSPYTFAWFNTQSGEWQAGATLRADANGGDATPAISGWVGCCRDGLGGQTRRTEGSEVTCDMHASWCWRRSPAARRMSNRAMWP